MPKSRLISINDVKKYASEYSNRYGGIKLEWSGFWDLFEEYHTPWPHNARPGCYAIFDTDRNLLYIGKASHKIGSRLKTYFNGDPSDLNGRRGIARRPNTWGETPPRYIVCVAVKETWEASSLEEFLIQHLRPIYNTVGNSKHEVRWWETSASDQERSVLPVRLVKGKNNVFFGTHSEFWC